jgi:biotin carboxylase
MHSTFGRLEEFKYLVTTLTSQNCIEGEIKSRLKSDNAWYCSVQNVLWYSLVYRNINIKVYRTVILCAILYGWETWSLALREERRLREFESRVLRGIFGPKRDEVTRKWRKLHN